MEKYILIILCWTAWVANAQTTPKVTWDYPAKPGTAEWSQPSSLEDYDAKLNIPEHILKELDTESLIQICLDYPALTAVLLVFNTPQQGFEKFFAQFNGIRELMSRKDVGHCLLKKYGSMSLKDFNPLWSLEKQGDFSFRFYYMELFLVQPQSLHSLDVSEHKLLLRESLQKFYLKASRGDLFGGSSLVTSTWILARTLQIDNKLQANFSTPSNIERSLNSGFLVDFDVQSVFQQAKEYADE